MAVHFNPQRSGLAQLENMGNNLHAYFEKDIRFGTVRIEQVIPLTCRDSSSSEPLEGASTRKESSSEEGCI